MPWIALLLAVLALFAVQILTVLIREYCRPQKAAAWLILLYLFPFAGFLLYWFAAQEYDCNAPPSRESGGTPDCLRERLAARCADGSAAKPMAAWPVLPACRNALPVTAGNAVEVYFSGEAAFDAMLGAMAAAEHHIHLEFYIIQNDALGARLQQLLIRKAREGVKVRLVCDGIGSRRLKKSYFHKLREAGVETGCFFPPMAAFWKRRINYRNHRKIVVVDGKIGFIGGMNVGEEYLGKHPKFGHWRDTQFGIRGDAVLWIQYTFLTDWHAVTGEWIQGAGYFPDQPFAGNETVRIIKSGPDEKILELMFTLIASAKRRVYIETPYFVPEPGIALALKTAALSGVDVRVIIPAVPDYKLVYGATLSYVRELKPSGIRFFRYRKGFLHAKMIICDDIACSGSTNMDMRSLAGQFEIDALFADGTVVERLVQAFRMDQEASEEVRAGELEGRPLPARLNEVIARLLSPLF